MTKVKREITIGCDPELFVYQGATPVSAHDLLPGTKYNPCKVTYGAVQVDGVAAEFNIDPAPTQKIFIRNMKNVIRILHKILENKGTSYVLRAVPSVHFAKEYFDNLPPDTKALGCEPDYDAYTKDKNPKPETTKPMRTGSGHVHIGWSDCNQNSPDYIDTCCDLVKELDFTLYRSSLSWDSDEERAELYGRPGAFRFKPYGLEYRVLSNKWVEDEGLAKFVFDMSKSVAARFLNGERFKEDFSKTDLSYEEYLSRRKLPVLNDYYSS